MIDQQEILLKQVIEVENKIGWFNTDRTIRQRNIFISHIKKLALTNRLNRLLTAITLKPLEMPNLITPGLVKEEIQHFSTYEFNQELEKEDEMSKKVNTMFLQQIIRLLNQSIANPQKFSHQLFDFFSADPTDLILFAQVTFPSIYSSFFIPELLDSAITVALALLKIDPGDIATNFTVSIYSSHPLFCNTLLGIFNERAKHLESKSINLFIESLRIASQQLTQKHFELLSAILSMGKEMFVHIFIDNFFIHFFIDKELINVFKSMRKNLSSVELDQIIEAISHYGIDEFHLFGGMNCADLKDTSIRLSTYELQILQKIYQDASAARVMKNIKRGILDQFISGNFKIASPKTNLINQNLALFEDLFGTNKNDLIDSQFNKNPELERNYAKLCSVAQKENIPPLFFLEPSIYYSNDSYLSHNIVHSIPVKVTNELKAFALNQIYKDDNQKIQRFDSYLSIIQLDLCLSRQQLAAETQQQYLIEMFHSKFH